MKSDTDALREYITRHGGKKIVRNILIANNGIAAVKCIRSMRKWAYETFGNERIIQFIVMATPEDLKINAEYIRLADQIEEVPGGRNTNNYANVDLIVEIALRRKVDAVWAGWGHASENPKLPDALSKTEIAFIGPPANAMRDLGDKIASTLVAQSANVSCVPWSGSGITVNYASEGIPKDTYQRACVETLEEAKESCKRIGFPLMLKASEGGGGKGIRKVLREEDMESAFRQVQGEVPGSPIFAMKMLYKVRHLEVQVLGDQYGEAIALYGRDCSVQRRHQKIIEEGPPIIAPEIEWLEMEQAAIRMAKVVGYQGVGTVEYLFEEETQKYYFLELNPRLQVEHPVTELITNINLPACQLHVAMGIPMHRIPQIRKFYGEDPLTDSQINFMTAKRTPPKGHVIAVRITGENPAEGFKPTSGAIQELTFRSSAHVWGYFSVTGHGGLHEYADSQFGHIFAHGDTREETRKALAVAIKEISIRGDISTPVMYLSSLIETEVFKKNQATTQWLDELIANQTKIEDDLDPWLVVICGTLFKGWNLSKDRQQQYLSLFERGQIPSKDMLKNEDNIELIYLKVKYRLRCLRTGPNSWSVSLKGKDQSVSADTRSLGDGGLLILLNGTSHICYGSETANGLKLVLNSRTVMFTTEYDPTQLRTTTAGKLVRYIVENGSHLNAKQAYAEMEVMKMYMPLITEVPGVISYVKPEGSVLEPGAVIATLKLDDPKQVRRAEVYEGDMHLSFPPHVKKDKVHQKLRETVDMVDNILSGYYCSDINKVVEEAFKLLYNPELPVCEIQECLSQLAGRIPEEVESLITRHLEDYRKTLVEKDIPPFDGAKVRAILEDYAAKLADQRKKEFTVLVDPLVALARKFEKGVAKQAEDHLLGFISKYYEVEKFFETRSRDNIIEELKQHYGKNPQKIFEVELSHFNVSQKNKLMLSLFSDLLAKCQSGIQPFIKVLEDIVGLNGVDQQNVSLASKQLITRSTRPSFAQRSTVLERELRSKNYEALVSQPAAIFDLLVGFFTHPEKEVRNTAVELYIKRAYRAYELQDIKFQEANGYLRAEWLYYPPANWKPTGSSDNNNSSIPSPTLKRIMTDDNLLSLEKEQEHEQQDERILQRGIFALFGSQQQALEKFDQLLVDIKPLLLGDFNNILKVVFTDPEKTADSVLINSFLDFLSKKATSLRECFIRRVTVVAATYGHHPRVFTFRERLGYQEHTIYRHIEPPLAYHLELNRLSNFDIEMCVAENKQIHLYYAEEKGKKEGEKYCCYFVRAMIRGYQYSSNVPEKEGVIAEAEQVLNEALNALELASGEARFQRAWNNHIFMKFMSELAFEPNQEIVSICMNLANKYIKRFKLLNVGAVEFAGHLKGYPHGIRFIITNPTVLKFEIDAYAEVKDPKNKTIKLAGILGSKVLEGKDVSEPYVAPSKVQRKRRLAHQTFATSYVYDFPTLFGIAVEKAWDKFREERKVAPPKQYITATELVLNGGKLEETTRAPGLNDIGMVAWRLKLHTPEYPKGRQIIVIANDITFQTGTFGVQEDLLFQKASELARTERLPRIYLAANSGARIGIAEEVRPKYRVAWNDEQKPEKGYQYLYVNDEEYKELVKTNSIQGKKVADNCWMITDIIGKEDSLGVENLKGSGMIAGETSRAYEDIFTLTVVTGRSVGIGAYLVRLGQRTIQNRGPIILTGFQALNKVLGRNVYTSNHQLGGIQIMYTNGVTHITVLDDLEAVTNVVTWLSYIPCKSGEPVPIIDSVDPVDRDIDFVPTKSPYDPRNMLAGVQQDKEWVSGFFDKGTFTETLGGWGKTVVTGRARLGGIPVGVIAVETRTVEHIIPADPAVEESREVIKYQAGQVWFPDSAYKTAQAIKDFNKGEELPLFIFANWRGFSGGLRDLFEEILKFGSYIVDGLREYRQPVFIYIPPAGELRGGAWVVVDPTINPEQMEMYADDNARGGVLEPNGILEIKYKHRDILLTMHRLDEQLKALDLKLASGTLSADEQKEVKAAIAKRELDLTGIYNQVATTFADLHDTPGRMKAKNVIREVVPWKLARRYFYSRLKRRLLELYLKRKMLSANPRVSKSQTEEIMKEWLKHNGRDVESVWKDDKFMIQWFEKEQEFLIQKTKELHKVYIQEQVCDFAKADPVSAVEGFVKVMESLSPEQKKQLQAQLENLKKVIS